MRQLHTYSWGVIGTLTLVIVATLLNAIRQPPPNSTSTSQVVYVGQSTDKAKKEVRAMASESLHARQTGTRAYYPVLPLDRSPLTSSPPTCLRRHKGPHW
jgi:hypothetical protein